MSDIQLETAIELNPLFRLQYEPAQECHVLLYPEGMVKLNGPASEILQQVDGQSSCEEITSRLQKKYPGADSLNEDVKDFLREAFIRQWLQYV